MRILGISAFYHDSAAALVVDGRIVAAVQEERFTRIKQDAGFPRHAIDYCLAAGGVGLDQVDYVVFYEKPFLKFERLLETYVGFAPRGLKSFATAVPIWIREKLFQKDMHIDPVVGERIGSPDEQRHDEEIAVAEAFRGRTGRLRQVQHAYLDEPTQDRIIDAVQKALSR